MIKIFTYGTLKKGHINHELLGITPKFIGKDTIDGELYSYSEAGIPFAFEGKAKIKGEIWEIQDGNFLAISLMELNSGYHLKMVQTDDLKENVIAYFCNDERLKEHLTKIEDWG